MVLSFACERYNTMTMTFYDIIYIYIYIIQCEAPKIAKLIYNFNNYGLYANNYSIHGVYKPSYNWGGPTLYNIIYIQYCICIQ